MQPNEKTSLLARQEIAINIEDIKAYGNIQDDDDEETLESESRVEKIKRALRAKEIYEFLQRAPGAVVSYGKYPLYLFLSASRGAMFGLTAQQGALRLFAGLGPLGTLLAATAGLSSFFANTTLGIGSLGKAEEYLTNLQKENPTAYERVIGYLTNFLKEILPMVLGVLPGLPYFLSSREKLEQDGYPWLSFLPWIGLFAGAPIYATGIQGVLNSLWNSIKNFTRSPTEKEVKLFETQVEQFIEVLKKPENEEKMKKILELMDKTDLENSEAKTKFINSIKSLIEQSSGCCEKTKEQLLSLLNGGASLNAVVAVLILSINMSRENPLLGIAGFFPVFGLYLNSISGIKNNLAELEPKDIASIFTGFFSALSAVSITKGALEVSWLKNCPDWLRYVITGSVFTSIGLLNTKAIIDEMNKWINYSRETEETKEINKQLIQLKEIVVDKPKEEEKEDASSIPLSRFPGGFFSNYCPLVIRSSLHPEPPMMANNVIEENPHPSKHFYNSV